MDLLHQRTTNLGNYAVNEAEVHAKAKPRKGANNSQDDSLNLFPGMRLSAAELIQ